MDLKPKEIGYGLLSDFPPLSFTMYSRNCKRLREFEEIEISSQSCRGVCEEQGGK
jgi:hypothetical protein